MRMMTFAAIHIGSYEVIMKVFELSQSKGMRQLDFVRYQIDLGQDIFSNEKIKYPLLNELCDKLKEFRTLMDQYDVKEYQVCATSSIREVRNPELILEQIYRKTGMKVQVLSNSEQRFLEYMSVAAQEEDFNKIIQKKTAIADVGGGSLQISLFDQDSLVTTQNIRLGTIWISEKLSEMDCRSSLYSAMMEELIQNDLECFGQLYLKGQEIKNLIVIGEFAARIVKKMHVAGDNSITRQQYMEFYEVNACKNPETIVEMLGISKDYCSQIKPTLILLKCLIERTKAETIWAPGTYLCDGMAYQFAVNKKYITEQHHFENDIMASARTISRRYQCNKDHTRAIQQYSKNIYDATKRLHNLGERERLLLDLAAMLHDCGKYISMANGAQNAYNIIMSTEIIGLSHQEREIVAYVIYFNTIPMISQQEMVRRMDDEEYLIICKLTSILRIANALDRSHRQKIQNLKVAVREENLVLTVDDAPTGYALERGLFADKITLFEEVYGLEPILKFRKR